MTIARPRLALGLCLVAWLGAGCGGPLLSAPPLAAVRYAVQPPAVAVPPVAGALPLSLVLGYQGIFQMRQETEVSDEVPPEMLVTAAVRAELASRGFPVRPDGELVIGCRLDQLAIRYRNYAGLFSPTDTYAWVDLTCRVTRGGALVWEGPAYGRWHEVLSGNIDLEDEHIPRVLGPALQQVVSQIVRGVAPLPPDAASVAEASALLRSRETDDRRRGIFLIGLFATPDGIPPLTQLLADSEPLVRSAAAISLGMIGTEPAMQAVTRAAGGERSAAVQWAITAAVLLSHDPRALAWLARASADFSNDDVRALVEDVMAHGPVWQAMHLAPPGATGTVPVAPPAPPPVPPAPAAAPPAPTPTPTPAGTGPTTFVPDPA